MFCKDILLCGEEPDELQELYQALRAQLQPQGALEELLFERIVSCSWRLKRLGQIEAGLFIRHESHREIKQASRILAGKDPYTEPAQGRMRIVTRMTTTEFDRERMEYRSSAGLSEEAKADKQREMEAAQLRKDRAMEQLNYGEAKLGEAFASDARNVDVFSKLSRYETAMEKNLSRALHELQRLQAERAGKPVLPPVVVDVNVNAD